MDFSVTPQIRFTGVNNRIDLDGVGGAKNVSQTRRRDEATSADAQTAAALAMLIAPGYDFSSGRTPAIELKTPGRDAIAVTPGLLREQANQSRLFDNPATAEAYGALNEVFTVTAPKRGADNGVIQDGNDRARNGDAAAKEPSLILGGETIDQILFTLRKVAQALQDARETAVKNANMELKMANEAANIAANNIRKQGESMLYNGISTSVVQGGMLAAGAGTRLKGIKTQSQSIKLNAQEASKLRNFQGEMGSTVRARTAVNMTGKTSSAGIELTDRNGTQKTLNLKRKGDDLSDEHTKLLSEGELARKSQIDQYEINDRRAQLKGSKLDTIGMAMQGFGQAGASVIEGGFNMQRTGYQAAQTTFENTEKTAWAASDQINEQRRQAEQQMVEMINLAKEVSGGFNGTVSGMADNLRSV